MSDALLFAEAVVKVISGVRVDLTNEKATQAAIDAAFTRKGLPFKREVRLSARDIPDFFAFDAVAVEVKIGGAKAAIFRQINRYAAHEQVKAIVLASNVPIALPAKVEGKPCLLASLGAAWL